MHPVLAEPSARARARRSAIAAGLASALACTAAPPTAEPATPDPARAPAATPTSADPRASIDPAPANPVDAPAVAPVAQPRACKSNERLDSGCVCEAGACFDICCGPNAGCAHPATPGGPSACILRPIAAAPPPRSCRDGELLSSGCTCDGVQCMDLCCGVGSACSHHSSPDGGYAKCVGLPKR